MWHLLLAGWLSSRECRAGGCGWCGAGRQPEGDPTDQVAEDGCRDGRDSQRMKPFRPRCLAARSSASTCTFLVCGHTSDPPQHRTRCRRRPGNGLGGMINGRTPSASLPTVPPDSPRFAQLMWCSPTVTILA
jgi:hypothetical protein